MGGKQGRLNTSHREGIVLKELISKITDKSSKTLLNETVSVLGIKLLTYYWRMSSGLRRGGLYLDRQ